LVNTADLTLEPEMLLLSPWCHGVRAMLTVNALSKVPDFDAHHSIDDEQVYQSGK
jgi:hypothetical protein